MSSNPAPAPEAPATPAIPFLNAVEHQNLAQNAKEIIASPHIYGTEIGKAYGIIQRLQAEIQAQAVDCRRLRAIIEHRLVVMPDGPRWAVQRYSDFRVLGIGNDLGKLLDGILLTPAPEEEGQ